jgi:hypothetical protein
MRSRWDSAYLPRKRMMMVEPVENCGRRGSTKKKKKKKKIVVSLTTA